MSTWFSHSLWRHSWKYGNVQSIEENFYFFSKFARKFLTVPGAAFIEALDWYLEDWFDLLTLSVWGSSDELAGRISSSSETSPTRGKLLGLENFVSKFFTVPAAALVFDLWRLENLPSSLPAVLGSSVISLLSVSALTSAWDLVVTSSVRLSTNIS